MTVRKRDGGQSAGDAWYPPPRGDPYWPARISGDGAGGRHATKWAGQGNPGQGWELRWGAV